MRITIPEVEMPKIYEWGDEHNKDVIDTDNIYEVCRWCMLYAKNSPSNDTKNILHRLNVGIYQLAYIRPLIAMSNAPAVEWSEAIASCMIHTIGSLENIGMDCALLFLKRYESTTFSDLPWRLQHLMCNREELHYRVLGSIPVIVQQAYYFEMARKNRFNGKKLSLWGMGFLQDLILLNEIGRESLSMKQAFALAMGKISDVELNGH